MHILYEICLFKLYDYIIYMTPLKICVQSLELRSVAVTRAAVQV